MASKLILITLFYIEQKHRKNSPQKPKPTKAPLKWWICFIKWNYCLWNKKRIAKWHGKRHWNVLVNRIPCIFKSDSEPERHTEMVVPKSTIISCIGCCIKMKLTIESFLPLWDSQNKTRHVEPLLNFGQR